MVHTVVVVTTRTVVVVTRMVVGGAVVGGAVVGGAVVGGAVVPGVAPVVVGDVLGAVVVLDPAPGEEPVEVTWWVEGVPAVRRVVDVVAPAPAPAGATVVVAPPPGVGVVVGEEPSEDVVGVTALDVTTSRRSPRRRRGTPRRGPRS